VLLEMRLVEAVGDRRVARAAFVPVGAEHEVVHEQLRTAAEEVGERGFAVIGVEEDLLPTRQILVETRGLVNAIDSADRTLRAVLYEKLRIEGLYQPAERVVVVTADLVRKVGVGGPIPRYRGGRRPLSVSTRRSDNFLTTSRQRAARSTRISALLDACRPVSLQDRQSPTTTGNSVTAAPTPPGAATKPPAIRRREPALRGP
jgi:hypothetical protein